MTCIVGLRQVSKAATTTKRNEELAEAYLNLGLVAQDRGRLDEAEGWYMKSLAITEALRDEPHMALSYHQLGRVAQHRGRLDEAEGWYMKSLAIEEAQSNARDHRRWSRFSSKAVDRFHRRRPPIFMKVATSKGGRHGLRGG